MLAVRRLHSISLLLTSMIYVSNGTHHQSLRQTPLALNPQIPTEDYIFESLSKGTHFWPSKNHTVWKSEVSNTSEDSSGAKQQDDNSARTAAELRCSQFNVRLFAALKILQLSNEFVVQRLHQFGLEGITQVELELVSAERFSSSFIEAARNTTGVAGAGKGFKCQPKYRFNVRIDGYSLLTWSDDDQLHFVNVRPDSEMSACTVSTL